MRLVEEIIADAEPLVAERPAADTLALGASGDARYFDAAQTRSVLAEADGALAGYALIHWPSEFASESDASRPLALHQLYCAPGQTGRGVGAALMEWALGEARALGRDAVQLSVWSGNIAAQRFYARYGFAKIADIGFMVGTQRDEEFLLERRL